LQARMDVRERSERDAEGLEAQAIRPANMRSRSDNRVFLAESGDACR
jgi:hypothetical protein